jgi:hypothetical protein
MRAVAPKIAEDLTRAVLTGGAGKSIVLRRQWPPALPCARTRDNSRGPGAARDAPVAPPAAAAVSLPSVIAMGGGRLSLACDFRGVAYGGGIGLLASASSPAPGMRACRHGEAPGVDVARQRRRCRTADASAFCIAPSREQLMPKVLALATELASTAAQHPLTVAHPAGER